MHFVLQYIIIGTSLMLIKDVIKCAIKKCLSVKNKKEYL